MKGILSLVILVLDILAIVDCVKSNKSGGQKALWIAIIILIPIVGLIVYYLVGKKK